MPHSHDDMLTFEVSAPLGNRPVTQWQTPHVHDHDHHYEPEPAEPDFDLVEQAFAESFPATSDPTSFLRLAGIPFCGRDGDGNRLCLLRVEYSQATDIGALTPHLGGGDFRYDPLPAKLTSRRERLAFVYQSAGAVRSLSLAEAKALEEEGAEQIVQPDRTVYRLASTQPFEISVVTKSETRQVWPNGGIAYVGCRYRADRTGRHGPQSGAQHGR